MNNSKCMKCGLINFASAEECRRCGASLIPQAADTNEFERVAEFEDEDADIEPSKQRSILKRASVGEREKCEKLCVEKTF